ncbi:hypothetical protein HOH87_07860 [bacterium]|jgi:hypothetical protein|nr:hypothetical protein [bacterium]
MSKQKKRSHSSSGQDQSSTDLTQCKHCGTELHKSDMKRLSKKELPARYGMMWTGIEYPYIQIYKITCPDYKCGKKYSIKDRSSRYEYC